MDDNASAQAAGDTASVAGDVEGDEEAAESQVESYGAAPPRGDTKPSRGAKLNVKFRSAPKSPVLTTAVNGLGRNCVLSRIKAQVFHEAPLRPVGPERSLLRGRTARRGVPLSRRGGTARAELDRGAVEVLRPGATEDALVVLGDDEAGAASDTTSPPLVDASGDKSVTPPLSEEDAPVVDAPPGEHVTEAAQVLGEHNYRAVGAVDSKDAASDVEGDDDEDDVGDAIGASGAKPLDFIHSSMSVTLIKHGVEDEEEDVDVERDDGSEPEAPTTMPSASRAGWQDCPLCGVPLHTLPAYREHMLTRHMNPLPYTCMACWKKFATARDLIRHTDSNCKEVFYKCQRCDRVWSSDRRHASCETCEQGGEQRPQDAARFECAECGGTFPLLRLLTSHVKTHPGTQRPFKCRVCGARHNTGLKLLLHARHHSPSKPARQAPPPSPAKMAAASWMPSPGKMAAAAWTPSPNQVENLSPDGVAACSDVPYEVLPPFNGFAVPYAVSVSLPGNAPTAGPTFGNVLQPLHGANATSRGPPRVNEDLRMEVNSENELSDFDDEAESEDDANGSLDLNDDDHGLEDGDDVRESVVRKADVDDDENDTVEFAVDESRLKRLDQDGEEGREAGSAPKNYPCRFCPKVYHHSHQIRGHMKAHTNQHTFVCRLCEKTFRQSSHLQRHLDSQHGLKGIVAKQAFTAMMVLKRKRVDRENFRKLSALFAKQGGLKGLGPELDINVDRLLSRGLCKDLAGRPLAGRMRSDPPPSPRRQHDSAQQEAACPRRQQQDWPPAASPHLQQEYQPQQDEGCRPGLQEHLRRVRFHPERAREREDLRHRQSVHQLRQDRTQVERPPGRGGRSAQLNASPTKRAGAVVTPRILASVLD